MESSRCVRPAGRGPGAAAATSGRQTLPCVCGGGGGRVSSSRPTPRLRLSTWLEAARLPLSSGDNSTPAPRQNVGGATLGALVWDEWRPMLAWSATWVSGVGGVGGKNAAFGFMAERPSAASERGGKLRAASRWWLCWGADSQSCITRVRLASCGSCPVDASRLEASQIGHTPALASVGVELSARKSSASSRAAQQTPHTWHVLHSLNVLPPQR